MKRMYSILLCCVMLIILSDNAWAADAVPESVIKATESVVRILAEYPDGYGTGSGFVIKCDQESTLIATNYHVVEGNPYSISVWINEEETVSASVLTYTDQKDICILELAYSVSLNPLTLAENSVKQGEAIYAAGFPAAADILSDKEAHTSEEATITDGIVSAVRKVTVSEYGTPITVLQINAAINAGNSGGPLFDADGKVVGINTYGTDDSQGIFGAIDICELQSFLEDEAVSITSSKGNDEWFFLATICAVVSVAIVVVTIGLKKKRAVSGKTAVKSIPLCEYMNRYPDGVGINEAVTMLLPVALQLRDLHDNGFEHLQVSPNSIFVDTSGAKLADASASEVDRYSNGYAAPEIYKGENICYLSDIYAFCAVLSYVTTGKHPENSLSRMDEFVKPEINEDCETLDFAFWEIVNNGMDVVAENRLASMQEIIGKLSPYIVRSFANGGVSAVRSVATEMPVHKKPKRSRIIVAVILIIAFLLTLICGYIACYLGAHFYARNSDFEGAGKFLIIPQITKLHDARLVAFIEAGQLMTDRKYADSKERFTVLSGYLNADELAQESEYRRAVQYADANEFQSAISILTALSEQGYKDSRDRLLQTKYRYGVYLMYEKREYLEARRIFTELETKGYPGAGEMFNKAQYQWSMDLIEEERYIEAYSKLKSIADYTDANEALSKLTELMYFKGQQLYYEGDERTAKEYFNCISGYLDSEKYIILISAEFQLSFDFTAESHVDKLIKIFYFEDAAERLLAYHEGAMVFLRGTWSGDGFTFSMEEDGSVEYTLPHFNYGDFYRISNGVLLVYPEGDEENTRSLFTLKAITPDCIEVFCYHNNRTYTLYRR